MKLIYRPETLKNKSPEDYADKLTWKVNGNKLTVTNPTPFYMNFGVVQINHHNVKTATFVAPNSSTDFALTSAEHGDVTFKIINDYGGMTKEFHSRN